MTRVPTRPTSRLSTPRVGPTDVCADEQRNPREGQLNLLFSTIHEGDLVTDARVPGRVGRVSVIARGVGAGVWTALGRWEGTDDAFSIDTRNLTKV